MADRGKEIDAGLKASIRRLSSEGWSKTKIAREARVSRPTAYKYAAEKTSKKTSE